MSECDIMAVLITTFILCSDRTAEVNVTGRRDQSGTPTLTDHRCRWLSICHPLNVENDRVIINQTFHHYKTLHYKTFHEQRY